MGEKETKVTLYKQWLSYLNIFTSVTLSFLQITSYLIISSPVEWIAVVSYLCCLCFPQSFLYMAAKIIFQNTWLWLCYSSTQRVTSTNPLNHKLLSLLFMVPYTLALNHLLNLNSQLFHHMRQYPDSADNFTFLCICSKHSYFIFAFCLRYQLPYMPCECVLVLQISFLQPMWHLSILNPSRTEPRALHIDFQ